MIKKVTIFTLIVVLLNMFIVDYFQKDVSADSTTLKTDQADVIRVEEKGEISNKVNWSLMINERGQKLDNDTIMLTLAGHHKVNEVELAQALNAKGIELTKPDVNQSKYVLKLSKIDQPISIAMTTETLDDNTNYTLSLTTTVAGQKMQASDTFYQKMDVTGNIAYKNVPETVTKPAVVISLINKTSGAVVQQQTISSNETTYTFKDVNKLNVDNQLVEYEVKTEPLGNYKTTVNQFDIEQTYMTTEVKGTVTNETGKPLTIEFVNQATKEAVDSMTVDENAETYVADQLPLNDEQGQKIAYEVSVPDVEGYDKKINDYNIALTKSEEPTTEEPTTEEATTEKSTTEETTTEKSTTEKATTEEATTEKSTTEETTTEEATTEEPTTEKATTEEATTEKSTTEEPTTEKSTTEEATTEEATTEEATTEEATTEEAMTEETTTEEAMTEEATTEKSTTEEPVTEEAATEEATTEEATTEEAAMEMPDAKSASTNVPVVKAPVEDSVVYTPPKTKTFSLRTFSLAPTLAPTTLAAAATSYTPSDYTYTSNTYTYGSSFSATLTGVMATDQSKIDWTMTITNKTGYIYTANLENIVVNNLQYMTSMNLNNTSYSYSKSLSITKGRASAYSNSFYLYPNDSTFKFSTPITNPNQSSYSITLGSLYSSGDYPMNLTGTFTLNAKSATPTVKPVSIYDTSVKGTAAPGAVVKVMNGTTELGTATADSAGTYSVTIPKQSAGTVLSVTSTESNKRVSDPTNVTVSSSVPITINNIYSDQTYVTGTAEPGALVTIKNSMGTVLGSTKASTDGLYFVELYRPLSAGTVITAEAVSTNGSKTATTTVLAADSSGTPGTGKEIVEPSPTYKGLISNMSWDERGLYRNRVPQPVEYNESFQWKAAQPTTVTNEYAIDLKTQGRASVTDDPLDIVLVVDNSASMSESINGISRWQNMISSINTFIDDVTRSNSTTNPRVRIDVVNYASAIRPTLNAGFSGDPNVIKSKLYPSYVPSGQGGGTFTQAGLNSGISLLKSSKAVKKVMIVLTDGAPTLSYQGTDGTSAVTMTKFNETIKGNGTSFQMTPYIVNNFSVSNHGQPTISQALLNKTNNPNINIFSIGIDVDDQTYSNGTTATKQDFYNVLNSIASKKDYAYQTTGSSSNISNVLNTISQNVSNSISNGIVSDPIGTMYDLNLGSDNVFDASDYTLTASDPTLLTGVTVTYDSVTRTIKLNGLTLGKGEWVNINYKVKLRVTDDSFVENQWYPMNGTTTLKPTATSTLLREYPVPEARAVSPVYSFTFNKLSDSNTPLGGATFELKDSTGKIMTQTSSTNGLVKFDNLKKGTYTLTETAAPTNYSKDPKTYTVVIASNGDIKVDGVLYSGTNVFKVINKKVLGSIEVVKHQSGDESKLLAGATFELRDSAGKVVTLTTGTDGKALFSALPLGSYTLVETKAPAGYQLKTTPVKIDVTSATKVVVKVANQSNSAVLPNTGGPGPLWFSIIGILVIIASLFSRKKFAHMN
ncbi:SpaA isopeptide-forming pilin-related protein [Macrococcus equipercicus]|uniref:VWA domain-containing protein n=1 Tax=Macrococcus equipercicus TaxID=69967 RepID=A0A9Q9BR86_9STAP|nr:SpaA isopeptide-forming pilin-related protein [Macrococcus equipercicus]UTH14221.1 VWA domain-containing protein [Macrococcus equipercicus]